MKLKRFVLSGSVLLCLIADAQEIFIYDEQSSIEGNYGEGGSVIQPAQPMGQSFTPELSSVGFVRLYISDDSVGYVGGNVYVKLLANSITGTLLGQSQSVLIPTGGFAQPVNFLFTTPVSVTSGVTYYFQPIANNNTLAVAGDLGGADYSYLGGTAFFNGAPVANEDLWFREGIYTTPEPSALWLVLLGGGFWLSLRSKNSLRFPFRRKAAAKNFSLLHQTDPFPPRFGVI